MKITKSELKHMITEAVINARRSGRVNEATFSAGGKKLSTGKKNHQN